MLFGKYINKYYIKYGILFLIGILTLVFIDYVQLYVPEKLGEIVDLLTGDIPDNVAEQIYQIILSVFIVAVILFVGRATWRLSIFRASSNIEADLRHKMFLKAERLSQEFYHNNKIGTIMNWFTTDIEAVEEFFGWGTIIMVDAFFMSTIVMVKMALLNWVLSIVCVIPIVLIIIWGFMVEKYMDMKWENRQKETDKLFEFSQENFTGIRVIKAFVKETQQLHAFAKVARKNADVNVEYARISVIFNNCLTIIVNLILALILGFGAWFVYAVVSGNPINIFGFEIILTAGQLVTYVTYFEMLVWPLCALGQIFAMRAKAKTSLRRITAFLDADEKIILPENPEYISEPKGEIKLNNLSFTYPDGLMPSLKNISLTIKPGETVGIVGRIGSGKTTLVNSLLRLYNLEPNAIEIDGHDMMQLDIHCLRSIVAYVPQDNFLFSDKISANVAFGQEEIDEEEVRKALELADVKDDVDGFRNGLDTITGERGVTLSGGQKQRISIARAFMMNAPIMILDDSVSAVDLKTEEHIIENIKTNRKGKTTIVVASRISTVNSLDKIIVLNNGELEAFDTPKNLLKTSPTYQRLSYLQKLESEMKGGQE